MTKPIKLFNVCRNSCMFVHTLEMMDSIKVHYNITGIIIKNKPLSRLLALPPPFISPVLSLTQPVKLQVGSCDCSTDFTQCNYCSDTRTERYKEKKEALQVISTKHWEKSNGESMRNFEAYQASSGTAGRKVLHFIISLSDFC